MSIVVVKTVRGFDDAGRSNPKVAIHETVPEASFPDLQAGLWYALASEICGLRSAMLRPCNTIGHSFTQPTSCQSNNWGRKSGTGQASKPFPCFAFQDILSSLTFEPPHKEQCRQCSVSSSPPSPHPATVSRCGETRVALSTLATTQQTTVVDLGYHQVVARDND